MENLFSLFVAYIQEVAVGTMVLIAFAAIVYGIYQGGKL